MTQDRIVFNPSDLSPGCKEHLSLIGPGRKSCSTAHLWDDSLHFNRRKCF